MVQRGRRAVYEPGGRVREADADQRDRVPPQGAHVRALLADRAARKDAAAPAAALLLEVVSHRHLRYGSGVLHLVLLATNIALVTRRLDLRRRARRAGRPARGRAAGVGIARYYVLVTLATLVSLWNYLRRGVPRDVGDRRGRARRAA